MITQVKKQTMAWLRNYYHAKRIAQCRPGFRSLAAHCLKMYLDSRHLVCSLERLENAP